MKKASITVALLLIVVQIVFGQEKVYLPLILKSGHSMTDLAVLEISDGVTTVDLINEKNGFHLAAWNPAIAGAKDGGTFQSSSLASGQRLVNRVFGNANEVMTLHVNGHSQDAVARHIQELLRLLEKAVAYWVTDWSNVTISSQLQNAPVWLKAQANCETNPRYALIHFYDFPSLVNPYAQPFFSASNVSAMNDLTLALERGHWLADEPGGSTCVEVSSTESWIYENWDIATSLPTGQCYDMVTAHNGNLVTGDDAEVWRTSDGTIWNSATASPAYQVGSMVRVEETLYLASRTNPNSGFYSSTDGGDNWTLESNSAGNNWGNGLIYASDDYLYLADSDGTIKRSNDGGQTWSTAWSVNGYVPSTLFEASDGYIYAKIASIWLPATTQIIRSGDGTNWTTVKSWNSQVEIYSWTEVDNVIYIGGNESATSKLWASSNGIDWSVIDDTTFSGVGDIYDFDRLGDEYIAISESGYAVSSDMTTWQARTVSLFTTVFAGAVFSDRIYAGDDGRILVSGDSVTLGRLPTCNNEVYVANKGNVANITHVKINDGGVFTDIFPISSFPQSLLPAVPAVSDAVYFGIQSTINDSGPFSGLVFDIGTGITSTNSYTLIWEYSDGGAGWPALTVRDNTGVNSPFELQDVNSVHWEQPSGWSPEVVDGITAFWIRVRVSALAGILTPPTQQNRDIYATVLPYVNIEADQVGGDIPAITQVKMRNQSDEDGRGGSAPDLWDNRLLVALRSHDRGKDFQAFLNIADEQNPSGVTVAATGANTAFAVDVTTPTGRRATYNPVGVEAMATQVTISLGPSIARDFYGVFHAFLRVQRTAGASTDFDVQLQIVSGSGGVSFTTPSKQVQTTTAFEVLDFGRITVPASGALQLSDLGDTTEIRIQASAASGTPNLNFYDLILIPTDEWAIDAVDYANDSNSIVGRVDDIQRLLDIDSVTNPRIPINATVRDVGSDLVTSIYNPITNGESILQANEQQRLWFFVMQTSATGTSYSWIAPPEIVHSIQVFHNARYLSLRGDR